MANIFPENVPSRTITSNSTKNKPVGYKESIFFDDETGDFAVDGQGRMLTANGIDACKQWCTNCMDTPRYDLASYSTDLGINKRLIFSIPDREAQKLLIRQEITEALLADDYKRIKRIVDIGFEWIGADAVHVDVTVEGIDGAMIDFSTEIGGKYGKI